MKIEVDRPVILYCSDWMGDYTIEGEFKLKHSWKLPKFCEFNVDLNKWESSREWHQRDKWEYKNESGGKDA